MVGADNDAGLQWLGQDAGMVGAVSVPQQDDIAL